MILSVIIGSIAFSRIVTGTPPLAKVMVSAPRLALAESIAARSVKNEKTLSLKSVTT